MNKGDPIDFTPTEGGPLRTATQPAQPADGADREGHQTVHVNTLRLNSVLPFQLFTEIDGEYLLYRRENLPFTTTQRHALLENGIEVLFVEPTEIERYWEYMQDGIRTILDDPDAPLEQRSAAFYESSSELTRHIIQAPVSRQTMTTAQALVSEALRFQHEGKETLHAMMLDMQTQPSIFSHSLNVCQYGLAIARQMEFSHQELEDLGLGLLFQDIGMLQIPESILCKTGPLSFDEWDLVKKHPACGLSELQKVPEIPEVARQVVFSHHERLDGSGYPQGLAHGEISLPVRISAVADVFASLTTDRMFRPANSTFDALRLMNTEMRGALDLEVIKVFIQVLGKS